MISLLFVCLGNICRSPALEAVMKKLVKEHHLEAQIYVDSCGINASFIGCNADFRMRQTAEKRGIIISTKAKLFEPHFFEIFDFIFVVDNSLLNRLQSSAFNQQNATKVHLATEYSKKYPSAEITDPYYGAEDAFDLTLTIAEDACLGILEMLKTKIQ